jgi:hypothetical protein
MSSITREEMEANKKKNLKYFDYAELPIKKWISSYLDKQLNEIFDDINEDQYDVILFNHNNKQWCVDFEIENSNCKAMIDSNYWEEEKCEKLNNSVKIMLEAIQFVYYPIINTMQNYKKNMQNIIPKFDPETLSFYFHAICLEKIQYDNIMNNINYLLFVKNNHNNMINNLNNTNKNQEKKLDTIDENSNELTNLNNTNNTNNLNNNEKKIDINKIKQELEKIDIELKKNFILLESYDNDKIKERENEIDQFNKNLIDKKRLYINIYEILEIEEELKLKRLPEISTPFHFTDEESLVDQLKKL